MVSIFLGVGLWVAVPNYREQAARRAIERAGGRIETRSRDPSNPYTYTSAFLVEVVLNDSQATDDTLAYLERLPPVQSLLLDNTAVSDAGLSHLKGLTSLANLRLSGTRVTDAGLAHLTGLRNLQVLSLDHTEVSDAGLMRLRELTGLDLLLLSDTKATEKGIAGLRQALPGTEVVVDQALATPPDPVPPESDIIRFRFRHAKSRAQTANGFRDLPETDFGELLFERKTGRCVYRYWYDGVHERPYRVPMPQDQVAKDGKPPARPLLKGAAAFDGELYWRAAYSNIAPRHRADRVDIYGGGDDLPEGEAEKLWVRLPEWRDWAPLHNLAATVGSDALERDKIHLAIQAFAPGKKHGPHAFSITARAWNYVVSLDKSTLGIRRVDVHAGMWKGHWPFPVPTWYSMERENAEDIDSKRLDELTDVEGYIDESTVVVE